LDRLRFVTQDPERTLGRQFDFGAGT
jgi:hypothetical protein